MGVEAHREANDPEPVLRGDARHLVHFGGDAVPDLPAGCPEESLNDGIAQAVLLPGRPHDHDRLPDLTGQDLVQTLEGNDQPLQPCDAQSDVYEIDPVQIPKISKVSGGGSQQLGMEFVQRNSLGSELVEEACRKFRIWAEDKFPQLVT